MRRDGVPVTPRLEVRCRYGDLGSSGGRLCSRALLKSTCHALLFLSRLSWPYVTGVQDQVARMV
jgi:hypothetical protein